MWDKLYQVPAGGGVPRKLNSSLVSGGNVKQFFVTGNQWVVYLADQEVDERFELYSASLTDGKIVKLSGNLQSAGNIVDVAVSPDGTFAVYRADQEARRSLRDLPCAFCGRDNYKAKLAIGFWR